MLGIPFERVPSGVPETERPDETPREHAERLAREKALAVARLRPDAHVLGCDTIVVLDGEIVGKPRNAEDAVAMLLRLAGRAHTVVSAVAIASPDGRLMGAAETTEVRFRAFGEETARRYVATGEPLDKAGAYGVQGYGSALVAEIHGDYYTVVGLPLARALELLEALGWRYAFGGFERL